MKRLICVRITKMSNGNDVRMNSDIQLAIVDDYGNIEVEIGAIFPAWVYPAEIEAGDELEIKIKKAEKK